MWDFAEYVKLRANDGDMGVQAPIMFQCHQTDADFSTRWMCAGWVGCQRGRELMALRLTLIQERISPHTFEKAQGYESLTPLFGSGAEAAGHG